MVLIIAALLEAFDALSSVPTLFGDMSEIPGPGFGGFLIKAHIATHPVLALAVLVFAAIGQVRYADHRARRHRVHDLAELHAVGGAVRARVQRRRRVRDAGAHHRLPADGGLRHRAAARNQRLGLATALASIPTFYSLIGLIIFAIGVSIYGF